MGNNHGRIGLRLLRNEDCWHHLQLGKSASIDIKEREYKLEGNGKMNQTWKVCYTVEGLTCTLTLVKYYNELKINIEDYVCKGQNIYGNIRVRFIRFSDTVRKTEGGLLDVSALIEEKELRRTVEGRQETVTAENMEVFPPARKTTDAWGGVTETTIWDYMEGTRKGLIVREWKKKRGDEKPYRTVAHYFIRVSEDGGLDYGVDGPVQHPSSALLYMFGEVSRTRTWKPEACPHCKQRSMFSQSESEDNESTSHLPPRYHGTMQNPQSFLANDGVVRGNNNGNFFVRHLNLLKGR
ncbi:hypothetical protein SESBI_42791 [Sesbania bispinosa]|nr:hypothetical protein SESBI_42791 [Sesbania bispinosa]